ncbi:MgtC/SapB family protein [Massilia sp. IC2-278]|uniref:MgtC/SapB family protein n=1 Tax=Massilia sp. IC2-278 TaxID=2887200 RepID=UPI001E548EE6|nr:MgtC/SapB family protein [Massilia sp. IC2-278]MCC2961767.1 MgtC/SapB family protein [Massilia sp. IC2-278]
MAWYEQSWLAVQEEFSDLGEVEDITRIVVRMLVAIILGGLLGYERESAGASAGLRTHMLVSLGSALFVLIPLQAGMKVEDLSRVLQGVTAGIGFLGAGAILKQRDKNDIRGLTTAASVWLTAAVGIAAGMGREATAVLSALFALVILAILRAPRRRPGLSGSVPSKSDR